VAKLRDRNVARSVIAVIVGYLIFALSAFAFFQISGQPPHQAAPVPIMIGSITLGMVSALLGGFVAAWLARRRPLAHGAAVATVLALGAAISLLNTMGKGAVWSQVAALVLMAPCAVLGGWLRLRQVAGA
jgi:putative membrane protein (TIGR04086 family)